MNFENKFLLIIGIIGGFMWGCAIMHYCKKPINNEKKRLVYTPLEEKECNWKVIQFAKKGWSGTYIECDSLNMISDNQVKVWTDGVSTDVFGYAFKVERICED